MEKLFGLPIDTLLTWLLATLLIGFAVLAFFALRNRVLFRLGIRNIARRPAQTALIVLGLMLATLLVSAALVTGDTMNYSIKKSVVEGLGQTDIVIRPKTPKGSSFSANATAGNNYLTPKIFSRIDKALAGSDLIDGLTPVLREHAPAASAKSRRNLPGLEIAGLKDTYAKEFGALKTASGSKLSIAKLKPGQAYINKEAAEKLEAKKGSKVELFINTGLREMRISGVFEEGGEPSNGPLMVTRLADAQEMFAAKNRFNEILISGQGDDLAGADHTKAIQKKIKPILDTHRFEISPVKKAGLSEAKDVANIFTGIFLVFGQFSMVAGVMLIFLIFVMLAAERKVELGVMRALGGQRFDLLKIFMFEGTLYAILSAFVGSLLGIAVGWGIVKVMAKAFGSENLELWFHFDIKSIIIAYAIGVVSTFIIVIFSAWRAGRINIVRAVRDLPEPIKTGRGWKSFALLFVMFLFAILVTRSGYSSEQQGVFTLGLSMLVITIPLLARWLRLPDRAAYTIAGLSLLILWLMPEDLFSKIVPGYADFSGGIELFFISGVAIITGAVWTVMYNSDIIMSVVTTVFSRMKGLPPMLRIAVNYPMKNRIRTGLALAMVALVIFTMVFMSVLLDSMSSIYDDTDKLSGGYEIQANTGYANPVKSVKDTLAGQKSIRYKDLKAVGSFSMAPIAIRQADAKKKSWTDYSVTGIDSGYADSVNYKFRSISPEYKSAREVWKAVAENPDLAVVHSNLVPTKVNFNVGESVPPFQMSGFYRETKKTPKVFVEVKNALTGKTRKLRVIGVIDDMSIYVFGAVLTSQKTIDSIMGTPVPATTYWFKLKSGKNVKDSARALAKAFYKNGMETKLSETEIGNSMQASKMMNRLIQGFMGLGLIVGIAALGVIAARSVVERRRQIGMLRAIGFRRGMVQNTFILESSFIALMGIGIGASMALILSRNVVTFMAKEQPGMVLRFPWIEVIGIAALAYAASLLTTYLPARQASKVYPAEALRYE